MNKDKRLTRRFKICSTGTGMVNGRTAGIFIGDEQLNYDDIRVKAALSYNDDLSNQFIVDTPVKEDIRLPLRQLQAEKRVRKKATTTKGNKKAAKPKKAVAFADDLANNQIQELATMFGEVEDFELKTEVIPKEQYKIKLQKTSKMNLVESLADPLEYENLFPGYAEALKVEEGTDSELMNDQQQQQQNNIGQTVSNHTPQIKKEKLDVEELDDDEIEGRGDDEDSAAEMSATASNELSGTVSSVMLSMSSTKDPPAGITATSSTTSCDCFNQYSHSLSAATGTGTSAEGSTTLTSSFKRFDEEKLETEQMNEDEIVEDSAEEMSATASNKLSGTVSSVMLSMSSTKDPPVSITVSSSTTSCDGTNQYSSSSSGATAGTTSHSLSAIAGTSVEGSTTLTSSFKRYDEEKFETEQMNEDEIVEDSAEEMSATASNQLSGTASIVVPRMSSTKDPPVGITAISRTTSCDCSNQYSSSSSGTTSHSLSAIAGTSAEGSTTLIFSSPFSFGTETDDPVQAGTIPAIDDEKLEIIGQSAQRHSVIDDLKGLNLLLSFCNCREVLQWEKFLSLCELDECVKLGEGTFGEVFNISMNGCETALKVIPFAADKNYSKFVNGFPLQPWNAIINELNITRELSRLADEVYTPLVGFVTPAFVRLINASIVKGEYPQRFLESWDRFLIEKPKLTENQRPSEYATIDQHFILLALSNGGPDLESYKIRRQKESFSIFYQIILSLAIAEEVLQFEHRDLHIGNLLIKRCPLERTIRFIYENEWIDVRSCGVEVSIIDFTNSRMKKGEATFFVDLSKDEDLFRGAGQDDEDGDYQYDIYRLMRAANGNNWLEFTPQTNLLWLHYLSRKLFDLPHIFRKDRLRLLSFFDRLLNVNRVRDFLTDKQFLNEFTNYRV